MENKYFKKVDDNIKKFLENSDIKLEINNKKIKTLEDYKKCNDIDNITIKLLMFKKKYNKIPEIKKIMSLIELNYQLANKCLKNRFINKIKLLNSLIKFSLIVISITLLYLSFFYKKTFIIGFLVNLIIFNLMQLQISDVLRTDTNCFPNDNILNISDPLDIIIAFIIMLILIIWFISASYQEYPIELLILLSIGLVSLTYK